jgi:RND family efflux transporter MFP subunit
MQLGVNAKKTLLLAAVAVAVLLGFKFFQGGKPKAGEEIKIPPRLVKIAEARPAAKTGGASFPGYVRASKRVSLAFEVSGPLVELDAREGRKVSKGEVIARIDPRDFANHLAISQAQFAEIELNYERTLTLWKDGAVPKSSYDKIKAAYDVAQANLAIETKALDDTKLIAPFTGVISRRLTENHEHVAAKQPIVLLQDSARIEIVVDLPEQLVARSKPGELAKAKVLFDAFPEKPFVVNFHERKGDADAATQTFAAVYVMDAPEDCAILPGMTASVTIGAIADEAGVKLLAVPVTAVFRDPAGAQCVYVLKQDNTLEKRVVVFEDWGDGFVAVSQGLASGEKVAAAGVDLLREGMAVRPYTPEGGEQK